MVKEREQKDIGIKCYCGSSTKYYYDKQMFKCDRTEELVFFYANHPCIIERQKQKEESER